MKRQLKAVIFDLDGVITDTAEYHFLAWQRLAHELEILFTREDNEKLKGISRMESLELLLTTGGKQKDYTYEEKLLLADQKNSYYQKLIAGITPKDILPGIRSLLMEIKKGDLKLGLASASKNAQAVMERLCLVDEFDYIVNAAAVENGKPDPEIFLRAASGLDVDPEECLGIEDAVSGVQAIKAAGMFAVAVGPKGRFPHADLVFERTELMSLDVMITTFNGM